MEFKVFKQAVNLQFDKLSKNGELFTVEADRDIIWDTYLGSFPEGTNPIYKERTEHDCQSCKQFIRKAGSVVGIISGELVSVWDIEIGGFYQEVADAMAAYVKSLPIINVFRHYERSVGTDKNVQLLEDNTTISWGHFHGGVYKDHFKKKDQIPSYLSETRSNFEVLKRSLEEITLDSAETVLELIEQNSLYRGQEHESMVNKFITLKREFDALLTDRSDWDHRCGMGRRDDYCWVTSVALKGASKIRNTVIGTLLSDLSEGKELDQAVKSFEAKVAPTNYKRPTALITKSMIAKAQAKVAELGFESALERRFAVAEDITINNVIFADRSVKPAMNVFDEMAAEVPTTQKSLDKVEEIGIDDFINNVVPKADNIEILFENKHNNNLMSLIAPKHLDSKNMFKWNNNFSWSYEGEVADSIKERVKNAGGNVTGDLRCSLSWFNTDDLDIHVMEPDGTRIYYSSKHSPRTGGTLDVDMNAGGPKSRNAVENITWANKAHLLEGRYQVIIDNFAKRETIDVGFDAEIEFGGVIHSFHYDKPMASKEKVTVAVFEYTHANGIKIIESLPSISASKEVWGINTETFNKVTMVMHSPNHWDSEVVGNKHWFFIIDKCNSSKEGRGFFNEFLKEDLTEHRKVFEVLGSKLKAAQSDNQLSGLGYSSTQRNHVFFKISGSFNRIIKVKL